MTEPPDVELLTRWRDGDAGAGEQLLARYFVSVYRYFAAHVSSEVDDLTQRTFEACIVGRDRIRDDTAFRGYLFGVARNQLASFISRKRKHRDDVPLSQARSLPQHSSPSRAFSRVAQQRVLLEAIAALPDDVRPTVEYFYLEGRRMTAIAEVLGVPLGTVKSRLFRARGMLREMLASDPDDEAKTGTLHALEEASAEFDADPRP